MSDREDDKFEFAGTGGVPIAQCLYCTHRVRGVAPIACPAFPGGIPDAILLNEFDHRKPHDGDHGIRFELREEMKGEAEKLFGWLGNAKDA